MGRNIYSSRLRFESNRWPQFFRVGKANQWKDVLTLFEAGLQAKIKPIKARPGLRIGIRMSRIHFVHVVNPEKETVDKVDVIDLRDILQREAVNCAQL